MKDYSVLDGMRKQTSEIIMQAFDKGYKQGYEDGRNTAQFCFNNEGYEEGLKDAWEAAKWIFNASVDDMMQTFGGVSLWVHYSASEAISRIKEYEEKQNNGCSFCIHCEMCGWIEAHKNCGCDCFDDGKMKEEKE